MTTETNCTTDICTTDICTTDVCTTDICTTDICTTDVCTTDICTTNVCTTDICTTDDCNNETTTSINNTTVAETTTSTDATTTTTETTTSTADTTTTEATTSTTDTTTEATTSTNDTTTTTETIEEPTETTVANIASDEELCNWAINDYKSKNKPKGIVNASITKSTSNQYEITLTDDSENILDIYKINPVTGIGTNSNNEEINLPQTGNNSLKSLLITFGGLMTTAFGFLAVKSSGMIRRKKDEKELIFPKSQSFSRLPFFNLE